MIRRPPRSTRTDTLFPYTTLFRSIVTMLGIGITLGPRRIELVRIAHADQVTGYQPSQPGAMRHDIAPQIGRRRIAVLEEDRIAGSFIEIGHAPALDLN